MPRTGDFSSRRRWLSKTYCASRFMNARASSADIGFWRWAFAHAGASFAGPPPGARPGMRAHPATAATDSRADASLMGRPLPRDVILSSPYPAGGRANTVRSEPPPRPLGPRRSFLLEAGPQLLEQVVGRPGGA